MGSTDKLMNLLEETDQILKRYLERVNVMWVGKADGTQTMTWEAFRAVAARTNYNDGYGCAVIPTDFVIVGADGWLERREYDGAEWWDFKRMPVALTDAKPYPFFEEHWLAHVPDAEEDVDFTQPGDPYS